MWNKIIAVIKWMFWDSVRESYGDGHIVKEKKMKTGFTVEYLSEEEARKSEVLQKPVAVHITIEGEAILSDTIVALIKTKYKIY